MCNPTGVCLRHLIVQRGRDVAGVQRDTKLAKSSVYAWCSGRTIPSEAAATIADALGCSAAEVLAANARPGCVTKPEPMSPGAYGETVLDAARAAGLSLERVAAVAGVGRSSLYDTVSGRRKPRAHQVAAVAAALELDPVELAAAAGARAETVADRQRLQSGQSRTGWARRHRVSGRHVFGETIPQRPQAAWRAARARGASVAAAAATAAACRRRRRVSPLGAAVLSVCDAHGWSIAAFAQRAGVCRSSVERWIAGDAKPRGVHAQRVAALVASHTQSPW